MPASSAVTWFSSKMALLLGLTVRGLLPETFTHLTVGEGDPMASQWTDLLDPTRSLITLSGGLRIYGASVYKGEIKRND